MNPKVEAYKKEKSRVLAIYPEANHTVISVPKPYSQYLSSYKDSWRASRMWMGRIQAFAHELDIIMSEDNPSPTGEMTIIKALGFGRAFSAEAKMARRKASEARLVARQKNSFGYRQLVKEGKNPKLEAEKVMKEALRFMPE